uniref:Uncharacterized protein n=1 Tax=Anguilla anguilla TaxID=7936 RepID=A0A0E9U4Z7_ANGAN
MDKLSKNTVFYYLSKCIVLTDYNCNNIVTIKLPPLSICKNVYNNCC